MKKIIILIIMSCSTTVLTAQNVGIGTTEPLNKLQVQGNLLITTPTVATNTAPTLAQTKTMVNATTIAFLSTDSTGRIYDPGGPAGNYLANMTANANIPASANTAIELSVETMELGTGDSLIIKENSSASNYLLVVGNGYTTTGKFVFNSSGLYIIFKSNADAGTGAGFSLLFKRLYNNSASLPDVSGATGIALFFDTKNGSFRSGKLNNNAKGVYSTAMGQSATASGFTSTALGLQTTASGNASTAMGDATDATGNYSTAMGRTTTASGDLSTAMGFSTTASGDYSTAIGKFTDASGYASVAVGDSCLATGLVSFASGFKTIASGDFSVALGLRTQATGEGSFAACTDNIASGNYATAMGLYNEATGNFATALGNNVNANGTASFATGISTTASGIASMAVGTSATASGDYSTAMGNYVSTNNQEGSFIIGDNSTSTVLNSANANNFRTRFAGGYKLFTSANLSTGCTLFAGDNAWTTGSDVRTKENFAEVNGEDFLKKIAGFHLTSWNYKTQNPATFRHYGPMAQDFYAAFGKDEYGTIGNDTTINSADFAGVSFIAIQALEKRTQKIEALDIKTQKIEQLEKENAEMKTMLLQLRKEMDELKKPRL